MQKARSGKFIAVIVLVLGAVTYLLYSGVQDTMVYYVTISELQAGRVVGQGRGVRVSGKVAEATAIDWNPEKLELRFTLVDTMASSGAMMPVVYKGVMPDVFRQGIDVVVEGEYQNGVFHANTLLAKCPSKYEAKLEATAQTVTDGPSKTSLSK